MANKIGKAKEATLQFSRLPILKMSFSW